MTALISCCTDNLGVLQFLLGHGRPGRSAFVAQLKLADGDCFAEDAGVGEMNCLNRAMSTLASSGYRPTLAKAHYRHAATAKLLSAYLVLAVGSSRNQYTYRAT